ncbi:cyclic nucleotide-binding/CBS domain-containing protein [Thermoproteota archaeon]
MTVIKVSDYMVENPVTVSPLAPVLLVARLMKEKQIGSIIIERDMLPVGVITERDLVWRVISDEKDVYTLRSWDICSKPVVTIGENMFIEDAVALMRIHKIRRLVVVNRDGLISGIITSDDILDNFEAFSKKQAFDFIIMSRSLRGRSHNL